MEYKTTYHICDANPMKRKFAKTSSVQVWNDTDSFNAHLIKVFRYKVKDPQGYEKAWQKAEKLVSTLKGDQ